MVIPQCFDIYHGTGWLSYSCIIVLTNYLQKHGIAVVLGPFKHIFTFIIIIISFYILYINKTFQIKCQHFPDDVALRVWKLLIFSIYKLHFQECPILMFSAYNTCNIHTSRKPKLCILMPFWNMCKVTIMSFHIQSTNISSKTEFYTVNI